MLFACIIIWLGAAACSVVINEVEANPAGDEDAFKTPITAWFELYNNDDKEVDVSGWSINTSQGRSMVLPPGAVIRALDYYVLDVEAKWLAHSGEVLVLLNATGAEVDRTAALSDQEDNEGAWTRDPDGRDTNSTDDWKFLACSRGF
ncbi:MAG: lamin tail domain-containing protein [Methanotrichaceae archaeon]|nr:lamin tail domain-containing protein [Methanotrichaceae archaeon]